MKKKILLLGIGSILNVYPTVTQASFASSVSELITTLRQEKMLQADGSFIFKDEDTTLTGQFLCDDTVITEKVKAMETAFRTPDFNIEAVRDDLNGLLKCMSVSTFETKDDNMTAVFTGHFSYPAFADGSVFTVKSDGSEFQMNYGLNGRQQTVTINATTSEGKTIGNFLLEYDVDASSPIFELGVLAGISSYAFPNMGIEEKVQREVLGLSFPAWKNSRFSKAEIYRPTGEAFLLYNKELNNNYTLDIFSSENKKITALNWNGQVFNLKVDFPKSNMTLLETKLTFPSDFGEKYEKYLEQLYVNKGKQLQDEIQMGSAQLISGVKNEAVVYGLNGKPLAQLTLKVKEDLNLIMEKVDTPLDMLDTFEVKNLGESGCSINTISFNQIKPEILTICREDGCQDENFKTMTSMPEIMGCFGELPVMFQRFQNELKQETETLSKAFMDGVLGGLAMKRYVTNEILDSAAKVAVIAMSKNAGQGGNADLSELGGVSRLDEEVQKVILTDSSIRADQNGQVTIELEPNAAKEIMPVMSELLGDKVVSGCIPDTNICVFQF